MKRRVHRLKDRIPPLQAVIVGSIPLAQLLAVRILMLYSIQSIDEAALQKRTGYRSGERRGLLIRYTTSWVRVPPGPPIIRRISLVVRILGFQSGEKGSIPLCAAKFNTAGVCWIHLLACKRECPGQRVRFPWRYLLNRMLTNCNNNIG